MKLRKTLAALSLAVLIPTVAACGASETTSSTTDSSSASTSQSTAAQSNGAMPAGGGPGQSVDPASVTTEEELIDLIQEAYGDGSLDLHRGHQPVQDVLDEVLAISHEELHVRMEEQGQNLAAVAEDLGLDPTTLIDALVESWSPAIDALLEAGTISEEQAEAYRAALEEAFTFRVTWDGQEATPSFTGLTA
ncbi:MULTISPECIES: hypothetical protein [Nocardioides]|uniref:Lipoprotein n=1 Tax=Nocardioides vastitatis TaxID=2568655 RepID=A0ABW0ZHL4_9ACTN|nr:hypothetical protein [Nocardioides sp.]THJ13138.1 hypothetical protein E7Z54_01795 [Nocardioides sp.]